MLELLTKDKQTIMPKSATIKEESFKTLTTDQPSSPVHPSNPGMLSRVHAPGLISTQHYGIPGVNIVKHFSSQL